MGHAGKANRGVRVGVGVLVSVGEWREERVERMSCIGE